MIAYVNELVLPSQYADNKDIDPGAHAVLLDTRMPDQFTIPIKRDNDGQLLPHPKYLSGDEW